MINSKVTNINNIRKSVIPYMMAWVIFYAWMVVFFTWWVNDFNNNYIFMEHEMFIIYSLFLLFISIISFLAHPKGFKKYFKIGGIGSIIVLVLYYLSVSMKILSLRYTIYILPLFMGLSYVGLLQTYIYIMNNTEKFYSVVFGNFILIVIVMLQDLNILDIVHNYMFLILMLVLSLVPMIKFKINDYDREEENYAKTAPKVSKVLYASLFINCIFLIFCRGVGRGFILVANEMYPFNLEIYYYAGALIGCILIFIIYTYIKRCNSITWNIVFSSFIFAAFLYMWPSSEIIKNLFAFVLGLGVMMGVNSMYYILGVISKKYWNFTYVRYNILIIAILGCGVGTLLGNYIYNNGNELFNNYLLTFSVFMMIVLLVISPIFATTFFRDKWDEDSKMAMIDNKNLRKFSKYNLTFKEIEACNYIVSGLTVRQIAACMNISENTVKFHKKQIFKKLDINSKEELVKIMNKE